MNKNKLRKNKIKPPRVRRYGKKPSRAFIQEVDLFGEPVTEIYFKPRRDSHEPPWWAKRSCFERGEDSE